MKSLSVVCFKGQRGFANKKHVDYFKQIRNEIYFVIPVI